MNKFLTVLVFFISVIYNQSLGQQNINIYNYIDLNDRDYQWCLGEYKSIMQGDFELVLAENNCKTREESLKFSNSRGSAWQKELNNRGAIYNEYFKNKIDSKVIYVENATVKKALKDALKKELKLIDNKIAELGNKNLDTYPDQSVDVRYIDVLTSDLTVKRRYLSVFSDNYKNNILIGQNNEKQKTTNNNIEAEFLAEIRKINTSINKINQLANNKQIVEAFAKAQKLCDDIRIKQGQQYFAITLRKIRKENPHFSFTVNSLNEQITREYWITMRNRTNLAYRSAMEAYRACVYNEGIQSATQIEIPVRFLKATMDLVFNTKDLFDGKLWGSVQAILSGRESKHVIHAFVTTAEEVGKAGDDYADWKSYIGVAGGFLSSFNGFVQTFDLVKENNAQKDLLVMNRQSAKQLIESNKKLLEEFDKYRAFIDAHSSSIDCLNDKLMRLNLDNNTIKGDKITIWGTGLFDWDGDEFITIIKESGEDLKNGYIYCEDFVKTLQITVKQADDDYRMVEEKLLNSGAEQNQINAQLSYNRENGDWFEQESTRLSEYYVQFCENPENIMPDDVIVVSTQVVPGVEVQGGNPDDPPVWEYETNNDNERQYDPPVYEPEQNRGENNRHASNTKTSSGNGWSVQKTSANQTDLKNDITSAVNSGKTPAGIYVGDNGEVEIYYIDDNPLGMTAWNLEWYTDVESLQNGINGNLEGGYFPMGISFTENGKFYVLYIMSELEATAWQLVESEPDLNYVSNNIQPYIYEKYIPVGITIYNGLYYTLLAQVSDSESVNWTIEGCEDNDYYIQQNINEKINSGFVPFGYLKEQGVVNVLYIGF